MYMYLWDFTTHLQCQYLHRVSSILAFLLRINPLIVVVAPSQMPLHYLYCSDRYYSALYSLESEVQVLLVVVVLLAQLELLLLVMARALQTFSLSPARIDRL
jgi:hypothetical protein